MSRANSIDEELDADGNVASRRQWPATIGGNVTVTGTAFGPPGTRPLTPIEQAEWQTAEDEDDRDQRRAAIAAKVIADLEASAAQIDARADFYDAQPPSSAANSWQYVNTMKVDMAGLARRVADLQQTVAHLIRVLNLDEP